MTRTREDDRDHLKASLRALISEAEAALRGLENGDMELAKGGLFGVGHRYRQIVNDARAWDRWQ